MAVKRADFPLPDLSDERTAEFFAGAARGELMIPKCDDCARLVWYPANECPACGGSAFTWVPVYGRGHVFSWAVVRRPFLPAFEKMVPFVTGLVSLAEDPVVRIVSYIVDCEREAVAADMAVRPARCDSKARLRDLGIDGVDVQVLYPSVTLTGAKLYADGRELEIACVRAYNEWLAEFCEGSESRLVGQAIRPTTGVDDAIAE